MTGVPAFLQRSALARSAYLYAEEGHRGQIQKADGTLFISHPVEVAELLNQVAAPEHVVAAGLLHDTVEQTDATAAQLAERFGLAVAELVDAVSENPSLTSYRERKADLREKATASGKEAAVLFAADKVSKVRQYRAQLASAGVETEPPRRRRLYHYRESLRRLQEVIPGHPLVITLRGDLAELEPLDAAKRLRPAVA